MTYFQDRSSILHKFLVDLSNFKVNKKLNAGGFGAVYSIREKTTNKELAAKILYSEEGTGQNKKMINREIGIMMRLHHPTIIQFYGYSLTDFNGQNNVTIIMNLAKNGSLATVLQNVQKGLSDKLYDNTARQKILIGVARGMMHLHQNRIIHRDLKPGNVLIDENFNPQITDFGVSKIYEFGCSQKQTQSYGTSIYMAPEVISGDPYHGKADVYSFAILMYEVVTDSIPYPSFHNKEISPFKFNEKIVRQNYRPEFKEPIKESLKKLIIQCWSHDPKDRPTFEEIFNKLAFNVEDSVYDVFADEDEYKYYLDDVDVEEVLSYAYDIDRAGDLNSTEIQHLKGENEKLKSEISALKKANQTNGNKIKDLEETVTKLLNENKEIQKRLAKIESSTIKPTPKDKDLNVKPAPKDKNLPTKILSTNSITFKYDPSKDFKGILSHLVDISKGKIENEINITSSSYSGCSYPRNVILFNKRNRFCSDYDDDAWICFDFKKYEIILTNYTIKSSNDCPPKSWDVQGSVDSKYWSQIDEQRDCQNTKGRFSINTFPVSKTDHQKFRYIRIHQIGRSWDNTNLLIIDSVEFYGTLIIQND